MRMDENGWMGMDENGWEFFKIEIGKPMNDLK